MNTHPSQTAPGTGCGSEFDPGTSCGAVCGGRRKLRTIPCCCCLRPKWRETDPADSPGHYTRMRLRGWCSCIEDAKGFIIKEGPMRRGWAA